MKLNSRWNRRLPTDLVQSELQMLHWREGGGGPSRQGVKLQSLVGGGKDPGSLSPTGAMLKREMWFLNRVKKAHCGKAVTKNVEKIPLKSH